MNDYCRDEGMSAIHSRISLTPSSFTMRRGNSGIIIPGSVGVMRLSRIDSSGLPGTMSKRQPQDFHPLARYNRCSQGEQRKT
jgi:hypothetical protein